MTDKSAHIPNRFDIVQRYPLGILFGESILLGWLATWLVSGIPSNPVILPLLAFPVSYIPTIMAVIVLNTSGSPEERRTFRQRLTLWRVGLQ